MNNIDVSAIDETIIPKIKEQGIVRHNSYVTGDELAAIKDQTMSLLKQKGSPYEFGIAGNFGPLSKQSGAIRKFFDTKLFNDLATQYMGGCNCRAVMATHDYIVSEKLGRQGFLHFDRTHTYKYFLYLTDCYEDDGVFKIIPGTRELGGELRTKAWQSTRSYGDVENRLDINYSDLGYKAENAEPMVGPAGTLIVFDTDLFHMGGIVKDKHQRVVIRSHYV